MFDAQVINVSFSENVNTNQQIKKKRKINFFGIKFSLEKEAKFC